MLPDTGERHYLPASLHDRPLSILLVGCGGNGAQMLMGLASLDTALRATSSRSLQVTTVDDDVVTEANLGRQPFFGCDVGNSKSRTLTERINLAHGLGWKAVHGRAPAAVRIEDVDILPLARTMERTRNSVLQQRAQFRLWLARGRAPGDQFAAGHIRWSKIAAGLSGRLGDFTARYAGPARPRGHRIVVEDASGDLARGYHTPLGQALHPEIVIGNKAHARAAMTDLLRQYAASLRLGQSNA